MSISIIVDKGAETLSFSNADVSDLTYVNSVSLDGDTVQSDEFSAVIAQSPDGWREQWRGVQKNTPVWLITDNRREKYYYKNIVRVAKARFQLTAQSPIGRLVSDFPGGLYRGESLPNVLADVIGGVIPYDYNALLESVRVYGWCPYQSRRETIHALAFAFGFLILRDDNQNLYFTVPRSDAYPVPKNAVFGGGTVDYRIGDAYYRIDVAAKDFYQDNNAQLKTLYNNASGGAPAEHLTVIFDGPMFDLSTAGNLSIDLDADGNPLSGVNYAVVSGVGILSGKPYAVSETIASAPGDSDADPENILSISDAPFVTTLNAVSVAEKLRDSSRATVVNMDILRSIQRPGDLIQFTDPFGDAQEGYIASLSGSITSLDRASASILCGYSPSWGSAYDSVLALDGSGVWTVPDYLDGKTLRIILVGGGQGGASGQHGSDDNATGSGRGLPGRGGNVRELRLTVQAGQTYQYQCGAGGAGGVQSDETTREMPPSMTVYATPTGDRYHVNPHCNGGTYQPTTLKDAIARALTPCENCVHDNAPYYLSNPGENGTDTVFGEFSTADGAPSDFGYYDAIDNIIYAALGPDNGVDGGQATTGVENGDKLSPAWADLQRYAVAAPWNPALTWTSGAAGSGKHYHSVSAEGTINDWAYGGLGGGAAVGADGDNGQDAIDNFRGGNGGDGATALPIFPTEPLPSGSGGSGGHGGGEAAVGGTGHSEASYDGGAATATDGRRGSGGSGANGQPGANGCVLIYFKKPDAYQYRFSIDADGTLILTYYTASPPPFSLQDGQLVYSYQDGGTPPAFEIRNRQLYLVQGGEYNA